MNSLSNMLQALRRAAESRHGLHLFGRDGAVVSRSFGQLLGAAQGRSAVLSERGVQAGDTVALILPTGFELVEEIFAVWLLGATPFCLPTPRLGRMADYSGSVNAMLGAANAAVVICEAAATTQLQSLAAATRLGVAATAEKGNDQALASSAEVEWSLFPGLNQAARDDIALIQFSSGATVDPKPVALSHGNLLSNTAAILARFPGDLSAHSGCSWLPLHHDMGLIGGLFCAVVAPGDLTLLRPEDFVARPVLWLQALSQSGATISPAPNFALQMCVERIADEALGQLDLSRWQMALIGAETVHEKTLRRFADRFAPCGFRYSAFTPVYGLAEATLAVTFSDIESPPLARRFDRSALVEGRAEAGTNDGPGTQSLVSVGAPLDGVDLEVRDNTGRVLPEGRIGRIFVRGPSVMLGYFRRPEASASALSDGWLDTGDLGFVSEGQLYIYGREKDIIIVNGRNYDPASIEFALDAAEGLQHDRAAAFALADEERGSESLVVLCEKERGKADAAALAQRAREAIIAATGLIPERVGILEAGKLPRTTSGKVRRGAAAQAYGAGTLQPLAESRR